ncbi:MAG: hypothetical protein ACLFWL_08670 [Candidatus Brocadiia bacterium]
MSGPVTDRHDTSHLLRCPSNGDFTDLGGGWAHHHSTYFYLGQAGFLEPNNELVVPHFYMSYRLNNIGRIVSRYGYPSLLFMDRVDFRRRWENWAWNDYHDSNHGKLEDIRGGNAAYSDGHVTWHNYEYTYTGTMYCPPGWQVSHNDAWSGFAIPSDCTSLIKNGYRTRFFYGPDQSSAMPWYDPLQ